MGSASHAVQKGLDKALEQITKDKDKILIKVENDELKFTLDSKRWYFEYIRGVFKLSIN